MIPAPGTDHIIKVARKVFRYDSALTDWGWTHDVYYDTRSRVCIIADFPEKDMQFEMAYLPELGPAEIKIGDQTFKLKVFEP
jgi:hypothetical protein